MARTKKSIRDSLSSTLLRKQLRNPKLKVIINTKIRKLVKQGRQLLLQKRRKQIQNKVRRGCSKSNGSYTACFWVKKDTRKRSSSGKGNKASGRRQRHRKSEVVGFIPQDPGAHIPEPAAFVTLSPSGSMV